MRVSRRNGHEESDSPKDQLAFSQPRRFPKYAALPARRRRDDTRATHICAKSAFPCAYRFLVEDAAVPDALLHQEDFLAVPHAIAMLPDRLNDARTTPLVPIFLPV